ncbi:hypothetical protein R1sor_019596 [Riccia sorocarpa]|uniref:Uncharacterized protein n=1 Tax=Riccia sorocarpa TaxID=122646 RepID=A0ABD3IEP7_9MARC
MATAASVLSGPSALYCPCSSRISEGSFVGPPSRNYPRQHFRSGTSILERQRNDLTLVTEFVDSLGRRRLTRNSGVAIPSSKRPRGRRAGAARAALPVISSIPVLGPVMNAVFNPVVLMIIYITGASRFWSGFRRTTYSESAPTKLALTALWPALYVASKVYRENFKKAVL